MAPPKKIDIDREMEDGAVMAVRYDPLSPDSTIEERAMILISVKALHDVKPSFWQALPLSCHMGIDMLYLTAEHYKHPVLDLATLLPSGGRNIMLETLTMDCDPESPRFGAPACTRNGGVMFKYREEAGYEMDKSLNTCLTSLEGYVTECLAAIKTAKADGGIEAAKNKYAEMGPTKFKRFFKEYRAQQGERHPGKGWGTIVCPVRVMGDACERCGAAGRGGGNDEGGSGGGEGENALQRCGKCRKVLYCDLVCQKEDWKAHKPFCQ
ncbi:hypothetical protein LTR37_017109 [Vermiconidia calcicola]|uniref:Uncharacterized protein n=1 Tax=Vermiconidia calcicola TaxID=1690605 RepID=A0ACC3MMF2_9PEZI|nr:hypothetical protein LTR37_017109 [Vermiconidia calcicola]